MTRHTNSGFTIIETMLFLAISAALFAAIMVGIGTNVERQRYRDTVNSLRSQLQEQYAQAANINNGRSSDENCSFSGSSVTLSPTGGTAPRGTSNCVILGRFIRSTDGVTLTTGNVIGHRLPAADESRTGWQDAAFNYARAYSTINQQSYTVAWGNKVTQPFHLMVLRSPQNGALSVIHVPSTPGGGVLGVSEVTLCVEGQPAGAKRTGVRIPAGATTQSDIQVMPETGSPC